MTPYELGYLHAFEKLGVYSDAPSGASDHISANTPLPERDSSLPAGQIASVLSRLGEYKKPNQEKAKGEETVGEQLERTTTPVSFSTASQVPTDPATGKMPTNPGVY